LDVHPFNFDRYLSENVCLFVAFHAAQHRQSHPFLPELKTTAQAFLPESNVSLGTVNCDQYHELCKTHSIERYPTFKLFLKGEVREPSDPHSADDFVTYLNQNCGTERSVGGLLTNRSGLVDSAQPIVTEFLESGDKASAVEKMRQIAGAEFYVRIMERYLASGADQLEKDRVVMAGILAERKGSWNALDGMQRRYNVVCQFLPAKSGDSGNPGKSEL
jgi:protein disulfide-isomerase A6